MLREEHMKNTLLAATAVSVLALGTANATELADGSLQQRFEAVRKAGAPDATLAKPCSTSDRLLIEDRSVP